MPSGIGVFKPIPVQGDVCRLNCEPRRESPCTSREYFTLGGCGGPERTLYTSRENKPNISLWEGVRYEQREQREYFTLGGCGGPERILYTSRENKPKYLNLGGCGGPKRILYTSRENKPKYLNLGGCGGPERILHTSRENKQNISLWEGVVVLKGYCIRAERTSRIFHFGRVWWS